jgi:hypothetical protein
MLDCREGKSFAATGANAALKIIPSVDVISSNPLFSESVR